MKFLVTITKTTEHKIDAEDLRDAQRLGYIKAIEIYEADPSCIETQVSDVKHLTRDYFHLTKGKGYYINNET